MSGVMAAPLSSGNAGPTGAPSRENWTAPVGVGPLGSELATMAVKCNESPYVGALELETSVTLDSARSSRVSSTSMTSGRRREPLMRLRWRRAESKDAESR